jgi:hypothetical protein
MALTEHLQLLAPELVFQERVGSRGVLIVSRPELRPITDTDASETVVNSASRRRGRGEEICRAKSRIRVKETEAFGVLFDRSLGGYGGAEIGGRSVRKLADKGIETADAGS